MTITPGRLGADRTDAVLAAVFAVAGLVQVTVWPIAGGVVGQLFVLGTTLPLAWRRTRPVPATLLSTLPWFVPTDGFPVLGLVVMVLQFFALGSWGRPRWEVAATSAWAAVATVVGTLLGPEQPVAAIGGAIAVVGPVLAGQLVAHLRAQNAELARLATRLEEERRRAERAAVESERARIAQELHDVVGHEVTLIAVQAEAASAALRQAPERAAEPVEAIRATAHRTLAEMRGVLDVLAAGSEDGRAATEDVTELARRAEAAGIANTLTVTGSAGEAHEPARLAVNRIVRECLTNAGRHAPGEPVAIEVAWEPDRVRVCASNTTPAAAGPPGRGLAGMRNRAELLGGEFAAGVRDGRFTVRVELPLVPQVQEGR